MSRCTQFTIMSCSLHFRIFISVISILNNFAGILCNITQRKFWGVVSVIWLCFACIFMWCEISRENIDFVPALDQWQRLRPNVTIIYIKTYLVFNLTLALIAYSSLLPIKKEEELSVRGVGLESLWHKYVLFGFK